jgi:antitoxin component YwqK of YwqJK toxin-antitoxin module
VGEWHMKNMMGFFIQKIVYDKEGNKLTKSVYNKNQNLVEVDAFDNDVRHNTKEYYDNGNLKRNIIWMTIQKPLKTNCFTKMEINGIFLKT